jgi:hypothetical protein
MLDVVPLEEMQRPISKRREEVLLYASLAPTVHGRLAMDLGIGIQPSAQVAFHRRHGLIRL